MNVSENVYPRIVDVMSDVFGSFPAGDELMRSVTPEEIKESEEEKVSVACTFGGAVFVHVKNGRVIKNGSVDHSRGCPPV